MNLAILGSTGNIGRQALDVISTFLQDQVNVIALTAHKNTELLKRQINIFKPKYIAITERNMYDSFGDYKVQKYATLKEIVQLPDVEAVLNAVVGVAGLEATIEALREGKRVFLSNKETLVAGGEYITDKGWISNIIPVDSEHSAIFQVLLGENKRNVKKIILTASGGALRDWKVNELYKATINDVLKHPVWNMGAKVTIDSATMVNKGLEVMEAYYLFGIENILPILHRQSIVHSMVEYVDGSIKAQLGIPDMRLPILYALAYPNRQASSYFMNFSELINISFEPMDFNRYPALKLAFYVLKEKGILPTVYNAANEFAVKEFMSGKIKFIDIYKVIEKVVMKVKNISKPSLDDIILSDRIARNMAKEVKL